MSDGRDTVERMQLLTVQEVAALLAISRRQVWRLSQAGDLPTPIRIGRSTRWRLVDLERTLKAGT